MEQLAADHELDRVTVNRYLRFMRDTCASRRHPSPLAQVYTERVHSFHVTLQFARGD